MGGILTHRNTASSSHQEHSYSCDSFSSEVITLRKMVKEKSKLILLERYVFVLYCPPEYPLNSTAEYIRDRVDLPIFPLEQMDNLDHAWVDEKYEKGLILLKFSSKLEEVEALKLQVEESGMQLVLFFFEMDGEVSVTDALTEDKLDSHFFTFFFLTRL
jgi:hypothetical protein